MNETLDSEFFDSKIVGLLFLVDGMNQDARWGRS